MRLFVVVTPRAARMSVERVDATTLRVAVTAPPHDGRANAAVVKAVAAFLSIAPSRVRLIRGQASRRKIIDVMEGS